VHSVLVGLINVLLLSFAFWCGVYTFFKLLRAWCPKMATATLCCGAVTLGSFTLAGDGQVGLIAVGTMLACGAVLHVIMNGERT
jgi:hypothetical protein